MGRVLDSAVHRHGGPLSCGFTVPGSGYQRPAEIGVCEMENSRSKASVRLDCGRSERRAGVLNSPAPC